MKNGLSCRDNTARLRKLSRETSTFVQGLQGVQGRKKRLNRQVLRVEIEKGGNVTIPSALREKLKLVEGDIVTIREENGDIKLIPQHQALAQARALAQQYLTHDNSVDDFLRWRKEEAIAEEHQMNRAFETK